MSVRSVTGLRQVERAVGRLSAGPVLVRGVVFVAATAALLLAYAPLLPNLTAVAVLAGLGLMPALLPRNAATAVVLFLAVLGWLISGGFAGGGVTLTRLVAGAGALYLLHTSAALAAVLPYDAIVAPRVLGWWFGRAGAVIVATALFAVGVAVLTQRLAGPTYLLASLAGLLAAAGLAGVLAYGWRR